MNVQEMRSNERHDRRIPVMLGSSYSLTVDVCAVGLCAESAHLLRPGAEVEGSFELNGERIAFAGRVVWTRRAASKRGGRMGVRFTRVPLDLQRLLDAPDREPALAAGTRRGK